MGTSINHLGEVRLLITLRRSRAEPNLFGLCRAEVESRAELVRAMPRCSNVSKKHGTSRRRSAVTFRYMRTASQRDATYIQIL